MNKFKKVNKEEFEAFVKNYKGELYRDVCGICEPPLLSYNDFSSGKVWPESMVAKSIVNEAMDWHPEYKGAKNDYWIMLDGGQEPHNIDPK